MDKTLADTLTANLKSAKTPEARTDAVLPSTKAIYQAFIDAIDRIKEKLNAEGN